MTESTALGTQQAAAHSRVGWSEGAVAELPTLWPLPPSRAPPGCSPGPRWPTLAHRATAEQEAGGGVPVPSTTGRRGPEGCRAPSLQLEVRGDQERGAGPCHTGCFLLLLRCSECNRIKSVMGQPRRFLGNAQMWPLLGSHSPHLCSPSSPLPPDDPWTASPSQGCWERSAHGFLFS